MMVLDRSFGYLVGDTARLFADRFNERAVSYLGLTRAQCRIIGCLAANPGINQAGLAELLDVKPMTLVRQIDRMEQDGWVVRHPDPADRRARQLQLTEKTRPMLARIQQLSGAIRHEAFAGLTRDEAQALTTLLRRVHGNLAATASLGGAPAAADDRRAGAGREAPPGLEAGLAAAESWR